MMGMVNNEIKIVVIGDGAVGKTCMLHSYTSGTFPDSYEPTIFDNYAADITINDRTVRLQLWDTAGQEDYESFIPLSYPGTSLFIVCFSVVSPPSLRNVRTRWIKGIEREVPGTPFILVGTKTDLRQDYDQIQRLQQKNQTPVATEQGIEVAKEIGALAYRECSALTSQGLKQVFDTAIKYALNPTTSTPSSCPCVLL